MTTSMTLENGDSRTYWEGIRKGEFLLQKCTHCGHFQFPPRFQCADCWETELVWIKAAGHGTVESCTIVRRAPLAVFREQLPYAVAAVKLTEGPRLIANVIGSDALNVAIGDTVVVEIDTGEERPLPRLRLA